MMKRISAIVLAVAMMIMSCVLVSADAPAIKLVMDPVKVSYNPDNAPIFEVDVVVTGQTEIGLFDIIVAYDAEVIAPVKADGTAIVKAEDAVTLNVPNFIRYGQAASAGSINYSAGGDYEASIKTVALPADGVLFSFRFKALKDGATGLALTKKIYQTDATLTATGVDLTDATDAAALVIHELPVAPEVSGVTINADNDGVIREGNTLSVEYNRVDANVADRQTKDADVITWVVDGVETEAATYTVAKADVGKEVKVKVLPVSDNPDDPEATAVETIPVEAKASLTYKPALEAADITAVTATAVEAADQAKAVADKKMVVTAAENKEYGDAEAITFAYEWTVDGTVDALATTNEYTFTQAQVGKAVSVKVTPSSTIVGETFNGDPVVVDLGTVVNEPPVATVKAGVADTRLTANKTLNAADMYDYADPNGKAEGATAYAWYVLDAVSDPLTTAAAATATFKLDAANIGKFVALEVTPVNADSVGGAKLTIVFANEIKMVSGGTPGTGVSLGTPSVPTTTPEPTDKPTQPEGVAKFTDVPADAYDWAVEAIDALTKAGVIEGMTETTFEPETKTTRAQLIALVARAFGLEAGTETAFTDVAADYWGLGEIAAVEALGALEFFGDALEPEKEITRDEMAAVIYNVAKASGVEFTASVEAEAFTDAADIAEFAAEAVEALQQAGIINGMGDGTFAPKGITTRAQAAKVIYYVAALIAE